MTTVQTGLMPDGSGIKTKVRLAGTTAAQNQHYLYNEDGPLPYDPHAIRLQGQDRADFNRFNSYNFTWKQLTTGPDPDSLLNKVRTWCETEWDTVRETLGGGQLTLNLTPPRDGLDPECKGPALFFRDFSSNKEFRDFVANDNCLDSDALSGLAEYVHKLCIVYPENTPNLLARKYPPFKDIPGAQLRQTEKDALLRDAILWQLFWARYAAKFKRLRSIELVMPECFIEEELNSRCLAQLIGEKSLGWNEVSCNLLPKTNGRGRVRLNRANHERPLTEADGTFKVVTWGMFLESYRVELDRAQAQKNCRPLRQTTKVRARKSKRAEARTTGPRPAAKAANVGARGCMLAAIGLGNGTSASDGRVLRSRAGLASKFDQLSWHKVSRI